jgi:hypothetical protein
MTLSLRSKNLAIFASAIGAVVLATVPVRAAHAQTEIDNQADGMMGPPGPPPDYPQGPDAPTGPMAPGEAGPGYPGQYPGADSYPPAPSSQDNYGTTLIPPNVEGDPYASAAGAYCYVGPHPVDTRVMPGSSWDDTQGQHLRSYPPIDMRLFAFRDGCYYFTGDPRDFGYAGQTYAYYGAHPILDVYGGGWCFMMGAHTHVWAPWSPNFTVVGPWYYWHGPYDPFFWAYWPYYSFYYRSYYPRYYSGGRFYRGGGGRVAPAIRALPARASAPVRGAAPTQMYRGSAPATPARGYPTAPSRPMYTPAPRTFAPAPGGGGLGNRGGAFRGGRR